VADIELDVNDIFKALREIIGEQAQQIAILKASLALSEQQNSKVE